MQENIKSYNSIYQLREAFKRSGGQSDTFAGEFNRLETPARLYFRIFFHFNTGYGLLNTGEEFIDFDSTRMTYTDDTNTATSYLYVNGELQRKQMLDDFVTLLSNINTYSPWYFQSIDGLQDALQRSEYTGEFRIEEEPKSITIKTLEDSYDNRISTLLDLYKAVAFSKIQHKEILPANLRRFDMSIYIINTPLTYVHYGYGDVDKEKSRLGLDGRPPVSLTDMGDPEVSFDIPSYREWAEGSSNIYSSAKLIELQGCEIDANSAASAYAEVKSDEPFGMTHEIKITFKNIIEQRFNDTLNRIIGDLIFMDMDLEDRKSKENIWGDADVVYGSEDMTIALENIKYQADWRETEEAFYTLDDEGNLVENYTSDPEGALNQYQAMMDANMEADEKSLREVEGKLITADSALAPSSVKNRQPGIPGMLEDFLRGATGEAKSYVKSAISKIAMGNLYWGSLSNPQSILNMNKLGTNLAHQALDSTVGKGARIAMGSLRSAINDAKATARGWISGSSIGSNMSGNTNKPAHRS